MTSTVSLCGIGICGAGLENWGKARAILAGESEWQAVTEEVPILARLPAAERRRVSKNVNLAMTAGYEAITAAGMDATTVPTVFATSSADGENCHSICAALASQDLADHQISPTRFHNSVQNAAAGYWAIANRSMAASTTISALDASFAAALLEGCAVLASGAREVLVISFDGPYPEPLHSKRPIGRPMSVALALRAHPGTGELARLRVDWCAGGDAAARPASMSVDGLESLRTGSPTGRSLPLLERIACRRPEAVALDYLEGLGVNVEILIP